MPSGGVGAGEGLLETSRLERAFPFRCQETQDIGTAAKIRVAVRPGRELGAGAARSPGSSSPGPLGEDSEGRRGRGRRRLPVPTAPARVSFCFWGLRGGRLGGWEPPPAFICTEGTTKDLAARVGRVRGTRLAAAHGRARARLGSSPDGPGPSYRPGRTAEWPPG